jgi:hypothetical protein
MKKFVIMFACVLLSLHLQAATCLKRDNEIHRIADFRAPDTDGVWIVNKWNPACTAKHCEVWIDDKIFFDQLKGTLTWQKGTASQILFKSAKTIQLDSNGIKLKILKASDRNYDVYLFFQGTLPSSECMKNGLTNKDGCHVYQFEVFPKDISNYIRPDDQSVVTLEDATCDLQLQPGSGQGIDPPRP